jgi:hypothetical protein
MVGNGRIRVALSSLLILTTISAEAQESSIPLMTNRDGPKYEGSLFRFDLDLSLGVDEGGPEWQMFYRFGGVQVAPDGTMYIDDNGIINVVSPRGDLVSRFGGFGEGPGEFQVCHLVFLDGGEKLWAFDSRLRRLSILTPKGRLKEIIPYPVDLPASFGPVHLGDRDFLAYRREYGQEGIRTIYGLVNDSLEWMKDVLILESREDHVFDAGGGIQMPIPFGTGRWVVGYPTGRFALCDSRTGQITVYDRAGKAILCFERDWERPRVDEEDRAWWLSTFEERLSDVLPRARRVQLPDRHPAFYYCRTDDSGRMWLCRSRPEYEGTKIKTYIYDVFDGEGTWLGTQSLPWHVSEIQKIQGEYLYRWDPGGEYAIRVERYRIVPLHPGLGP